MGDLAGVLGVMIPLSAIVLGIGVAFWSIYWDHQKKRLQYQERQLMIEKGLTPPDLPNERRTLTPEDCLRRGTVMLFLGIGLAVGSFVLGNMTPDRELVWMTGMASAVIGFLGLGNLVYYFLARNRVPKDEAATP